MPQGTASRIAVGLAGLLLAACGLAGCGAGKPARPTGVPATAAARQPRPITLADAKLCPVTLPHSGGPPGISPDAFFGWGASYGNGTLWVGGLWPRRVIEAGPDFVAKDGSVGMKFGRCQLALPEVDCRSASQACQRGVTVADRSARCLLSGPRSSTRPGSS